MPADASVDVTDAPSPKPRLKASDFTPKSPGKMGNSGVKIGALS